MKIILSLLLCFVLSGCATTSTTGTKTPGFFSRVGTSISTWWGAHKGQVGQTVLLAGKDLATFTATALLNNAQSPQDANNKADLTDELAYRLRIADKSSLVSADKLKAYLSIWMPSAAHWNTIISETASAVLAGGPSAQRLEAVAMQLNAGAEQVRATNNP